MIRFFVIRAVEVAAWVGINPLLRYYGYKTIPVWLLIVIAVVYYVAKMGIFASIYYHQIATAFDEWDDPDDGNLP